MKHVRVLNPNSNPVLARRMADLIRAKSPSLRVTASANEDSPAYIDTPAELAAALPPALARVIAAAEPVDLLVVACFSDIQGYLATIPAPFRTVSIADCSIGELGRQGQSFSIITGGHVWQQPIRRHVEKLGFRHLLASLRTLPGNAATLLGEGPVVRERLQRAIDDCFERSGARSVLLAGGGFIGAGETFRSGSSGNVVDCGECTADWIGRWLADPAAARSGSAR